MSDEPSAIERLKRSEIAVVELRTQEPMISTRLSLAKALLEMADALEELEEMPPVPGSEGLERALACVSEVADDIGRGADSTLDDAVFDALCTRARLLVMLGRPDETATTTAAIRARVGDENQQRERAKRLHAEATEAYGCVEDDPYAVHVVMNAVEQLNAPYADASPVPPDAVIPYLAAGMTLAAGIAIYLGQPDPARATLQECLTRFGDHPDSDVQTEIDFARLLLGQLDADPPAPR